MADENNTSTQNQQHAFLLQMFTYDDQISRLRQTMLTLGVTEEEFDAESAKIKTNYIAQAQDILNEAGFEGTSEEELLQNNSLNAQINGLADEMTVALAQEVAGKYERDEFTGTAAVRERALEQAAAARGIAPEATPEEEEPAAEDNDPPPASTAEEIEPEAEPAAENTPPEPSAEASDSEPEPEPETANLNTETYSGEKAQITAMQEVMGLPEVAAITGMELSAFGDPQTGEADGIKGSGTDAAFAALAEASGGRPDIAVYLQEIGVDDANAQKFAMAYASYKGAGNPEPLVLAENPNAVADIQTALRAGDEQIGLSLNGIDVNTGSAEARDQSDNTLGPLTARSIQGTVALAVASQAPEGTDVNHALTDENIGYVQAYLKEQGVEGADAIAANLRRVADDPALATQYAQAVVPDSIEYAGLTVPGSAEGATELAEADVPLEAFGGSGESFADALDGNVATNGVNGAAVPVSLDTFNGTSNEGVYVGTMTGEQLGTMLTDTGARDSTDANRVTLAALEARDAHPTYQAMIEKRDEYTGAQADYDAAQAAFGTHASKDLYGEISALTSEANTAAASLEADMNDVPLDITYTYITKHGFRGDPSETATETVTMSRNQFEEEYGDGGFFNINSIGEKEARAAMESEYAKLAERDDFAARAEHIEALRTQADGAHDAFAEEGRTLREAVTAANDRVVETGDAFATANEEVNDIVITFKVPTDIDSPQLAQTMIEEAGGIYTAATPTDPAAEPAVENDGQLVNNTPAEDTAEEGVQYGLNTQATVPGFGATQVG